MTLEKARYFAQKAPDKKRWQVMKQIDEHKQKAPEIVKGDLSRAAAKVLAECFN